MTTNEPTQVCGAIELDPPPNHAPFRCTEPKGHDNDCRAVIDRRVRAWWPGPTQRTR